MEKKIFDLNWIYLHKIFFAMYSIPYTRVIQKDTIFAAAKTYCDPSYFLTALILRIWLKERILERIGLKWVNGTENEVWGVEKMHPSCKEAWQKELLLKVSFSKGVKIVALQFFENYFSEWLA